MTRRLLGTALVATVAAFALVGCVQVPTDQLPDWLVPDDVEEVDAGQASADGAGFVDGRDAHGREMPYGTHGHGVEVLMLGRSVMAGWFEHWGWDWEHAVTKEGFAFYYGELESPPDIDDAAVEYVEAVAPSAIVFFKLGFADFQAASEADVDAALAETVGYVENVVAAAEARGITLVLGTALPETTANMTAPLAKLHSRYGAALTEIAEDRPTVHVFDLHDVLANQSGALYKGFAVGPGDAHLNDVAYLELDDALFEFLDSEVLPSIDSE